ncbi:MAG TPA: hypothetical protein VFU47_07440 [Armatimonadota bacterium]|nr:hypothetical protein [Armatimonadota bacterium]
MAKSIQSVQGAKVVMAPAKGSGALSETITQVELTGGANLAAVTSAVESCNTPHKAQCAPDVVAIIPGKLQPNATPESIMAALRKAGLLAE